MRAAVTAAARQASNGREFVEEVGRETGIELEILPADEEATLTARGALDALGRIEGRAVLVDIGGGSTEFVELTAEELQPRQSIAVGVVKLLDQCIENDPPGAGELAALEKEIGRRLNELDERFFEKSLPVPRIVANAGVPTTLAAIDLELATYDPKRVNGHRMSLQDIGRQCVQLAGLTIEQRTALPCMERGRADVILPGAFFLKAVMERFGADEVIISEGGLLEGLALGLLRD